MTNYKIKNTSPHLDYCSKQTYLTSSRLIMKIFLSVIAFLICFSLSAQKPLLSSNFQEKLDELGLEFYFPLEQKIKVKEEISDEFLNYDLILKSKNHFEIRYLLDPITEAENGIIHPRVRLSSLVATMATNNQEEYILISEMGEMEARESFGAEWGVYADFIPKKSFSHLPFGRVVSLFHANKGLVNCVILHRSENLDGFLGMPLRFGDNESME